MDYLLDVINYCYLEVNIILVDIEVSWVGFCLLLIGNFGFDYNGGDNGLILDKSFNKVVDIVSEYKENKVLCVEVEDVLNYLENSCDEKVFFMIFRGSFLERELDGLLILLGGKIIDYCKMVEGVL